ncbi:MAG: MarC family protein, partial [Rhodobacteraceae bacterium]|nr:MarC family protein [Paracoccaceae bacterium]
MEFEFLLTSFVALFIIIDPIGLTPVFIAITQGMDDTLRRKVALRSVLVSAFVISLFIVGGETVLGFIGISMPAFRIAGGILLFLTALDMLFQRRSKRRENQT